MIRWRRDRRSLFRRRSPDRRRKWLIAFLAGAIAAAVAAGGVIEFAEALPRDPPDDATVTDGIVVLTGGADRVSTGLLLLADRRARRLLVSGVHPDVVKRELAPGAAKLTDIVQCCVDLGYAAGDTIGNAAETAAWMRRNGFGSLRVVTANYHMPRSLLELQHALPSATIVPHAVFPEGFKREAWWRWPGSTGLIVLEFAKYQLARLRLALADFLSRPEAA